MAASQQPVGDGPWESASAGGIEPWADSQTSLGAPSSNAKPPIRATAATLGYALTARVPNVRWEQLDGPDVRPTRASLRVAPARSTPAPMSAAPSLSEGHGAAAAPHTEQFLQSYQQQRRASSAGAVPARAGIGDVPSRRISADGVMPARRGDRPMSHDARMGAPLRPITRPLRAATKRAAAGEPSSFPPRPVSPRRRSVPFSTRLPHVPAAAAAKARRAAPLDWGDVEKKGAEVKERRIAAAQRAAAVTEVARANYDLPDDALAAGEAAVAALMSMGDYKDSAAELADVHRRGAALAAARAEMNRATRERDDAPANADVTNCVMVADSCHSGASVAAGAVHIDGGDDAAANRPDDVAVTSSPIGPTADTPRGYQKYQARPLGHLMSHRIIYIIYAYTACT